MEQPEDVKIFDGFCGYGEAELKELYDSLNLAMTFKDFEHIHNYFKNEEKRDPSVTEIRVLDTYWSDHCRHTTSRLSLKDVTFTKGDYNEPMELPTNSTWQTVRLFTKTVTTSLSA